MVDHVRSPCFDNFTIVLTILYFPTLLRTMCPPHLFALFVPFSCVFLYTHAHATTHNTRHHTTTHMHSPSLPTSVVFLMIHDQLLISQDVGACLVSISVAMASSSDQAIVVGGGLAGMSAASTILANE